MRQFKVGDKVVAREDCISKAALERAHGKGPWRILQVRAPNNIQLTGIGWWHEDWFRLKEAHKEFTDEEYETLLV